jgi:hypothetical protein
MAKDTPYKKLKKKLGKGKATGRTYSEKEKKRGQKAPRAKIPSDGRY